MTRLVVLGDSLAMGATSLAVGDTRQSFAALLAEAMGLGEDTFRTPDFRAPAPLPFDIEGLARRLEQDLGPDITGFEWAQAGLSSVSALEAVRQAWLAAGPAEDVLYHNLSVWAFTIQDALSVTARLCDQVWDRRPYDVMHWPYHSLLHIARRVLNPGRVPHRQDDTVVTALHRLCPIEHLVVELGVNNCSRAVIEMEVRESGPAPEEPLSSCTLWDGGVFARQYRTLCDALDEVQAQHVWLATVPHVTVAPILRSIPQGYVHLIHSRGDFDPDLHGHLTAEECLTIDRRVDEFNAAIRAEAARRRDWHVVDVCGLYDDLAAARDGRAAPPLPAALADLSIAPFAIRPDGTLQSGGLVSLDGFHPTLCGSALVAQAFVDAMRPVVSDILDVDCDRVRRSDPLVSHAPRTLDDMFGMMAMLEERFGASRLLTRWVSLRP